MQASNRSLVALLDSDLVHSGSRGTIAIGSAQSDNTNHPRCSTRLGILSFSAVTAIELHVGDSIITLRSIGSLKTGG